ncbi:MAG: tetratricopeptide repeat protein [Bdellovibrionaceae bacterium]|jgi:tetratricopeptide (TPR) repeat protein|nr:tetratricopeptide repeat protein [Pseudobdellovibrionaceae bacterium]
MNSNNDVNGLFHAAVDFFKENDFSSAEPLLNQLILKGSKKPDVFHMLGTIFYDQGKFKKAVRSFKRALQLDPTFTDASIGLSIILNDLGKYDEGQKVFEEAQVHMKLKNKKEDSYINERIALKHEELAELYFRYERYNEALEQYLKAYKIFNQRTQPLHSACDCFLKLNSTSKAIHLLSNLIKKYPKDLNSKIKLGQIYYDLGNITQSVEIWENVLTIDPENKGAKSLLNRAHITEFTNQSITNEVSHESLTQ